MSQDFGQIIIRNKQTLIKEIATMLPATTIHLIGPSGSGKTSLIESLINIPSLEIDEVKILRLQGVLSEDFRMPVIKTIKKNSPNGEKEEKVVELVNMGVFQEILDNPDKKYLLFLDEILRADSSIVPLLFSILERRINGIPVHNMYVIVSSNFGEEYIMNFDFSDSALRRRQIFIEYIPDKEDIKNFMFEHNYHYIIQEIIDSLDIDKIIDHNSTTKELEQDSQLGSWNLLNHRWNTLKIDTYREAEKDILIYGNYFFSRVTKLAISNKLSLFKQLQDIDIQTEIIEKKGLKQGNKIFTRKGKEVDKTERITELKIRTKTFILSEFIKDNQYFILNFDDIVEVFEDDSMLFLNLLKDIQLKIKELKSKKEKNVIDFIEITTLIIRKSKANNKLASVMKEFIKSVDIAL